MSFRNKVKSKFSPQIIKTLVNVKDKEVAKSTYVFSLLFPILAKSPKEVNEIFKCFKKNIPLARKKILCTSFLKNHFIKYYYGNSEDQGDFPISSEQKN